MQSIAQLKTHEIKCLSRGRNAQTKPSDLHKYADLIQSPYLKYNNPVRNNVVGFWVVLRQLKLKMPSYHTDKI